MSESKLRKQVPAHGPARYPFAVPVPVLTGVLAPPGENIAALTDKVENLARRLKGREVFALSSTDIASLGNLPVHAVRCPPLTQRTVPEIFQSASRGSSGGERGHRSACISSCALAAAYLVLTLQPMLPDAAAPKAEGGALSQ
eukprot:1408099-Rhodomonas_salina.1